MKYLKGNSYSHPSMWDIGLIPEVDVRSTDYINLQAVPIDNRPLNFGKYRGRTPNEVYRKDPGYIDWISKNLPNWTELVTAQLVQHAVNKLAQIEARYEQTIGNGPDYQD